MNELTSPQSDLQIAINQAFDIFEANRGIRDLTMLTIDCNHEWYLNNNQEIQLIGKYIKELQEENINLKLHLSTMTVKNV